MVSDGVPVRWNVTKVSSQVLRNNQLVSPRHKAAGQANINMKEINVLDVINDTSRQE